MASRVTGCVAQTSQRFEVSCIQPHSPELDLGEYLNNTVKSHVRSRPVAQSQEWLQGSLWMVLRPDQGRPAVIRALSRHPSVAYAV